MVDNGVDTDTDDAAATTPIGHTAFSWLGVRVPPLAAPPAIGRSHPPPPPPRASHTAAAAAAASSAGVNRWPYEPPEGAVRYCALCAYDGGAFGAWMGTRTSVQSVIEERLARVLRRAVQVVGAGSTDAGAHA